jgi:preprotein translocase subunit SecA
MSVLKKTYEKIFGSHNEKVLKEIQPIVEKINGLEKAYEALSDTEVKGKTAEFKARLTKGESLDELLPEAFATVREAGKRLLGMRHYDVQMIGGIALHRGMIAEMRTGEGKTLVGTLAVYLNALEEKGVHLITVNDYLAKRDAVWMGQIYDFLGLSVGIIQGQRVSYLYDASVGKEGGELDESRDEKGSFKVEDAFLKSATRQEAYRADITYGTNNEFGFDYLRDNMVQKLDDMVMRPGNEMHYTVIDEIDSILIDEARTPLIISAPAEAADEQYYTFAKLVNQLKENDDYNLDEKLKSATLTDQGVKHFEQALGVENIYAEGGIRIVHHVEQALKAQVLFKRDKDYVVEEQQVVIIDEFTGRKMPGRRYSEGLHQAIEAKEGVAIQQESRTLATITFQNLFRMYSKLSGMTGTADTEEEEFRSIYGLDVLVIPTNRPDARLDHPDRIYKNEKGKYKAIAEQIKISREKGQPILVGTISVEKNEELSLYLTRGGVEHEILNAKNHEREGEIIAQAGRPGAVTLATNMAGRGVDIKLGGPEATPEKYQEVLDAGGLFVLGTERHESRRIDNQLRGRSARQGDSGETHFFVSTGDDLMRIFSGDRLKNVMTRLNVPDDMPIEQKMITKMLENAQKKVESHNYDIRKHLLEYDDILNKQRHIMYQKRRQVIDIAEGVLLDSDSDSNLPEVSEDKEKKYTSLKEMIFEMIEQEIEFVVSFHTNQQAVPGEETHEEVWNIQEIYETMKTVFPMSEEEKKTFYILGEKKKESGPKFDAVKAREAMIAFLIQKAQTEYERVETQVSETSEKMSQEDASQKIMHEVEKQVLLRAMDSLWVDYLVQMSYLRTGIGLRGYAQRDPLIEYKRESFQLFHALHAQIQKEVVYSFFKVGIGLQMAPSIMASDKMILKGSKKTSVDQVASHQNGPGVSIKKKMSKKERRKLRQK